MQFTSFTYLYFLVAILALYWSIDDRRWQNRLLLAASYFFYGYIHPWFCTLIAASTLLDYCCGLGIERSNRHKLWWLTTSMLGNLGLLAIFKYFDFFLGSVQALGWLEHWKGLQLLLPVGISFYTFQTMSYTIDIYRGELKARHDFLDFALFVSFFPQLVAGPIERAGRLLPQIEEARTWCWERCGSALSLFILGYLKKLVIADNIAVWVDRVFMLNQPSLPVLMAGSLGFALQIFADFSAYTDMARASSKLLGFELMENFNAPYLAISPSDFWRRWHISFSTWIRDYLYIPLGGSRSQSTMRVFWVLMATMGLSGLWHGAAWNFVAWGLFHACLLFSYNLLGCGGRWKPKTRLGNIFAWSTFQSLNLCAWALFRSPSLAWLSQALVHAGEGWDVNQALAAAFLIAMIFSYALFWLVHYSLEHFASRHSWIYMYWQWGALAILFLLSNRIPQQFIYFQF